MNALEASLGGWTVACIRREGSGAITFDGGQLHGLSISARRFDAANDGEVWCIYRSYAGDNALLAWGGWTDAHRSCELIAQRFLAGDTFPASPHCPCD
jgi:hypothetical protein